MEPVRIEFLRDNLLLSGLEQATCDEVFAARPAGKVIRTSEGWPVITIDRAGTKFILDGPLHFQVIERLGKEADCVAVVFGLGMGNTVRSLTAAGIRVAAVFEPDAGLLRSYLEHGPSDLGGIPVVTQHRELDAIWTRVVGDRDNVHLTDTPGYDRAFGSERSLLASKIGDLLERGLVNEQTIRARGRVWVEDIIDNAEYLARAPSAHHAQGAFKGVPAFVIGAGPSLDQNIEVVRAAAERGIVFAVNSSARALDKVGIKPHVLAALESIDVSPLLENVSYLNEVVRLFSLTAHPNLYRTGSGPLLTLFELLPHITGPFETFFGRPGLPVCGSVSTACFSLAYRMGCDPIVMVGQDLAYTSGRCYADGTPYDQSRIELTKGGETLQHAWCQTMIDTHKAGPNPLLTGQKSTRTTAWGGQGTVVSAATFNQVRMWFERVASLINESGGPRLINATEGGARIEHFDEVRLVDVVASLPLRPIAAGDIERAAREGGPERTMADVVDLLRINQQGAETVAYAAGALLDACRSAEAAWNESRPEFLSQKLRELQCAEMELKSAVARFPWVDAWAWADVDLALESVSDLASLPEALRGICTEARLAEAIHEAARELAVRLKLRQQNLASRYAKKS